MIQEAEIYQDLHTCTHISGVFGTFGNLRCPDTVTSILSESNRLLKPMTDPR